MTAAAGSQGPGLSLEHHAGAGHCMGGSSGRGGNTQMRGHLGHREIRGSPLLQPMQMSANEWAGVATGVRGVATGVCGATVHHCAPVMLACLSGGSEGAASARGGQPSSGGLRGGSVSHSVDLSLADTRSNNGSRRAGAGGVGCETRESRIEKWAQEAREKDTERSERDATSQMMNRRISVLSSDTKRHTLSDTSSHSPREPGESGVAGARSFSNHSSLSGRQGGKGPKLSILSGLCL